MVSAKLSFVIIEYNCLENIYVCVDSILSACKKIPCEIVISSNSVYSQEKQALLQEAMPHIKWVFNKNNKGFASGMNAGIVNTSGEIIVLLNPDLEIAHGSMQKAVDYLMAHQSVGLMGPRVVDQKGNIQDSCRKFMTLKELFLRVYIRIFHGKDVLIAPEFDYTSIQTVDWVIGAFIMVKRNALEQVGLLDPNYFLYVEDMDWCKRFWNHGFQVMYYPLLEVVYKADRKSISVLISKKLFNKHTFYHLKSYLRFLLKNKFKVAQKSQNSINKMESDTNYVKA